MLARVRRPFPIGADSLRVLTTVLSLAASVWTLSANGEIYKCVGRDGRVTYTDQTCQVSGSSTPMKIEPNVIDASADRALAEAQARAAAKPRDERPVSRCDRAARELEVLKREVATDPKALNAAYEAVLAACVEAVERAGAPANPQPRVLPLPAGGGEPPRN